jgi:hypothetical protein
MAVADVLKALQKAKRTDEVIACINGALTAGQGQPWMYTMLAMKMQQAGYPSDDIERVLLSSVDFSAVNVSNLLYSAAFLTRFGAKERALAIYRQASAVDPTRLEPYVMGLKLAREARDAAAVAWAATGILERAWGKDFASLHRDAEATAREMDDMLRDRGQVEEADRLAKALSQALERDLVIELSWSGRADLDLIIEEPSGAICSAENPVTAGGGIFTHDGFGGDQKDAHDNYVCPRGRSGDYRVTVRHISGEVVGKRAVLTITRYQGSPREIEEKFTVALSDHDKVVRVTLSNGRLKEETALPLLETPREAATGRLGRQRLVRNSRESQAARERFVAGRQAAGAASVGYQPLITVLSEGVSSTAMAVVSGDRRYVRMTIIPTFSAITDVQSFSFFTGGNANTGGPAGGTGGGAGTGTGVGTGTGAGANR